jgi:hypothetical protein
VSVLFVGMPSYQQQYTQIHPHSGYLPGSDFRAGGSNDPRLGMYISGKVDKGVYSVIVVLIIFMCYRKC